MTSTSGCVAGSALYFGATDIGDAGICGFGGAVVAIAVVSGYGILLGGRCSVTRIPVVRTSRIQLELPGVYNRGFLVLFEGTSIMAMKIYVIGVSDRCYITYSCPMNR